MQRTARVERNTLETRIQVEVNLDGTGQSRFETGVPFLEHMLDQVARHGLIDLTIQAHGDTHIDDHHTVEDIGITLGQALAQACYGAVQTAWVTVIAIALALGLTVAVVVDFAAAETACVIEAVAVVVLTIAKLRIAAEIG